MIYVRNLLGAIWLLQRNKATIIKIVLKKKISLYRQHATDGTTFSQGSRVVVSLLLLFLLLLCCYLL